MKAISEPKDPQAVSPTAIAEWVADVLRDRIVKGAYPPGARLVERKISTELNLSRTPVREALKLLHLDGLISISRNKGAQVLPYGRDEALALFEIIAALESIAAERLARTITPEQLAKLETMHRRMMRAFGIGDQNAYFDMNSEIHDFIVQNCQNAVLTDTHRRLIARARRGRYLAIMKPARMEQAAGEHETLMVALRAGDSAAAAAIWKTHLLNTGETVAAVLDAQAEAD